jgi:hypothetical protein
MSKKSEKSEKDKSTSTTGSGAGTGGSTSPRGNVAPGNPGTNNPNK